MTKEGTGAPMQLLCFKDSDTPNKRLQASRAAPLPTHKVSHIRGAGTGPCAFHPRIQMPLGFIETHLSVLRRGSKTEQGGGGVGLEPERPAFLRGPPAS